MCREVDWVDQMAQGLLEAWAELAMPMAPPEVLEAEAEVEVPPYLVILDFLAALAVSAPNTYLHGACTWTL